MNDKYEGRWLCPYCGAENLGRFEDCNGYGSDGCGAGRPKNVKFYLPENSPVVTDPELIADAESGADWHCSHCDSGNKGAINGRKVLKCVHCANARDASDHTHNVKTYSARAVPRSDADTKPARPNRRPTPSSRPTASKTSFLPVLAILSGLALALFAAWYLFFSTTETALTITSKSWERVVNIQQMTVVEDEGWDVPIGGRTTDTRKKYFKTIDEVVGHETKYRDGKEGTGRYREYDCGKRKDLGNGYFENDPCKEEIMKDVKIPYEVEITRPKKIYETWYTYEYDQWNTIQSMTTSGGDTTPHWHDALLLDQPTDHRAVKGSQTYTVQLMGPDGPITRNISQSVWERQEENSTVIGHYNKIGGLNSITWTENDM